MNAISYRPATASDAVAIAALHADSWKRHYRGAYSDAYLDGPVAEERIAVWTQRFAAANGTATTLAEDAGVLLGFAHLIYDAEPEFGPLVDNLHVRHDVQRGGVGRELMRRSAQASLAARPDQPMHLWVLEQNTRAQAFYKAIGGELRDTKQTTPPDDGQPVTAIRVVWDDPTTLL